MKKVTLSLAGIAVVVGAVALGSLRLPVVQDLVAARVVDRVVASAQPMLAEPDALNVLFCGTGGPFPDPDRAGPCALVFAGDRLFMVDSGSGGAQRLGQYRVPLGSLDGILYTHLHSDHISGLGDVALNSWAAGRAGALVLYGPPGVDALAGGFEDAFRTDAQARIDHHGADIFAPAARHLRAQTVDVATRDDVTIVYEEDGLKISAFRVTHVPLSHAYGYRFDYRGRSVIFSGDTVRDQNMVRFGAGVDLMVHEAMGMRNIDGIIGALSRNGAPSPAKILRDASEVHTSPVDAALIANEAGAGHLVFNHVVPPLPAGFLEDIFLRGVSDVRPEGVSLGFDGLVIRLPGGSDEIIVNSLK